MKLEYIEYVANIEKLSLIHISECSNDYCCSGYKCNQEKIFAIAHYSWRGVWIEETVNGSFGTDTDSQ